MLGRTQQGGPSASHTTGSTKSIQRATTCASRLNQAQNRRLCSINFAAKPPTVIAPSAAQPFPERSRSPMGLPAPTFAGLVQLQPSPDAGTTEPPREALPTPAEQPDSQPPPIDACLPPQLTAEEWAQVHQATEQAFTPENFVPVQAQVQTGTRPPPQDLLEHRQPAVAIDVDIRASLAGQLPTSSQHIASPAQLPQDNASDTHSSECPATAWNTWPKSLKDEMRRAAAQLAALADRPGTFDVFLAETLLAELVEQAVGHLAEAGQTARLPAEPLCQPLEPSPIRGHALRTDLFPSLTEADRARLAAAATGLRHRLTVVPFAEPASLQPIFDAMANETAYLYQSFWRAEHEQHLQTVAAIRLPSMRSPSPMPQGQAQHASLASREMLQAVRLPMYPPRPMRYSSQATTGLYMAMDATTSRHSAMLAEKVLPGGEFQAWFLTNHCPQTEAARQTKLMLATLRAVPAAVSRVHANLTLAKATLADLGEASLSAGTMPPLVTHIVMLADGPQCHASPAEALLQAAPWVRHPEEARQLLVDSPTYGRSLQDQVRDGVMLLEDLLEEGRTAVLEQKRVLAAYAELDSLLPALALIWAPPGTPAPPDPRHWLTHSGQPKPAMTVQELKAMGVPPPPAPRLVQAAEPTPT